MNGDGDASSSPRLAGRLLCCRIEKVTDTSSVDGFSLQITTPRGSGKGCKLYFEDHATHLDWYEEISELIRYPGLDYISDSDSHWALYISVLFVFIQYAIFLH